MTPADLHAALVAAVTARGRIAREAQDWMPDIEVDARRYYERYEEWPLADVISDVRNQVDEWNYVADPHEYCHQRPLLIRLLRAANDPARILRDVARDLDVLKRHAPDLDCTICADDRPGLSTTCCLGCLGDHYTWLNCPEVRGLAAAYQITGEENPTP